MPRALAGASVAEAEAGRHPWETARAAFFAGLLAQHLPKDRPSAVLDVGAGDGYLASVMLAALPSGSSVTCLDSGYGDEVLAQLARTAPPGVTFTRARPERVFDAVTLLDVIEHVIDDHGFVRAITEQSLRPGGTALFSVPAYPLLFTQHDIDLGHYRRYTRATFAALHASAPVDVAEMGGLFSSLLAPRGAQKLLELARGVRSRPAPAGLAEHIATDVGGWSGGPAVTRMIQSVLALDAAVGERLARAGVVAPGLSLWSVSRRKDAP